MEVADAEYERSARSARRFLWAFRLIFYPGAALVAFLLLTGSGDGEEALTTLAVLRYFLPDRNIMAAGGKEITLGDRLHEVFAAGVNAVMVGNYLTTMGTAPEYWQNAATRWGLKLNSHVEEIEPAPSAEKKSCGSHDCGCA